MKSSSIFLIAGIFIIAVGIAWIISGGIDGPAQDPVPQATTAATVVPTTAPETTTAAPLTTVPEVVTTTAPATTTAVTTVATSPVSSDDITNHFLHVAYTSTNRLERLNYEPGQSRVVISALSAGDDEILLLQKTSEDFNAASPTVKISENIKDSGTGDIYIKFLPLSGLTAINLGEAPEAGRFSDPLTRRELYQGDVPAAKLVRGNIYINADLTKDERRHMLVRSLMYQMGLTGDSTLFPDSVFYTGENTNTVLTSPDKKIITMLYADGFYNGMTMDAIRSKIYIP